MSSPRRVAVELAALVSSHAVVGMATHALWGQTAPDAHVVHLPFAITAFVVLVGSALPRESLKPTRGDMTTLLHRALGLGSYLLVETLVADGVGWHLLHDPWLAFAPLGVILACGSAAVVAYAGRAIWEAIPRARIVRPQTVVMRRHASLLVVRRSWIFASSIRGRAPPATG